MIAAIVSVGSIGTGAAASTCDLNGDGSSGTPYQVFNAAQFAKIGVCGLNKHYVQVDDIVLGDVTPVGTSSMSFSGSYRGVASAADSTPTVRSISIAIDDQTLGGVIGLFAYTTDAAFSHLSLSGTLTSQAQVAGALIGRASRGLDVTHVQSDVVVTGGSNEIGGLIGHTFSDGQEVVLSDVAVGGAVRPSGPTSSSSGWAGGLIGFVNATTGSGSITVSDVRVEVEVVGEGEVGGELQRYYGSGGLVGGLNSANFVLGRGVQVGTASDPVRVVGRQFVGGLIGELRVPAGGLTFGAHTVHADVEAAAGVSGAYAGGIIGQALRGSGAGSLTVTGPTSFTGSVSGGSGSQTGTGGVLGAASNIGPLLLEGITVDAAVESAGGFVGGVIGFAFGVPSVAIGGAAPSEVVEVRGTITNADFEAGGFVGYASNLGNDPDVEGLRITGSRMLASITSDTGRGTGGAIGAAVGGDWVLRLTDVEIGTNTGSGIVTLRVESEPSFRLRSTVGGMAGRIASAVAAHIVGGHVFVDAGPSDGTDLQEVGGIVGQLTTTSPVAIRGVTVDGVVSGSRQVGGVVGITQSSGTTVQHTIGSESGTPTTVSATVSASGGPLGGILGFASHGAEIDIDGVVMDGTVALLPAASATAAVGGLVGSVGNSDLTITGATMSGTVSGRDRAGGFIGEVENGAGGTVTIDVGTVSGTVIATAAETFSELRVAGLVAVTDRLVVVTGPPSTAGATIRAVHPAGTSDAAIFMTGGILVQGSTFDAGSVDPATADLTVFAGFGVAAFDLDDVAPAIIDAARCVISTGATVSRWRDTSTGGVALDIRRADPLSPDPCPEPAEGFAFRFENENDDGDGGVVTGRSGTGGSGMTMRCDAPVLQVGATVSCTVTGAPADIDILWRAAVNPTFATGVVRTDADGRATLRFQVSQSALGRTVTVELVDWSAPLALGTVAGPVPTGVPAGDGVSEVSRSLLWIFFGLLGWLAGGGLARPLVSRGLRPRWQG